MLYDTHCHFDTKDPQEIRNILLRARQAGVEKLLAIGGSPFLNETAAIAKAVADEASELLPVCNVAFGYDRSQIGCEPVPFADITPVAWGEIGLDYYYNPETREEQRIFFAKQLEEAKKRDLPVVIHTREADDDTLAILREIPSRGVIHCFTGSPDFCRKLLDLGFYISMSGIVTFRLADNVRESALVVPKDRLLIETDSPYLAPVPMRGKPNEPSFIVHTARFLAELRKTTEDELVAQTTANAVRLFGD